MTAARTATATREPGSKAPGRLSRERILDAALAMVREEGVDGLSLRRLTRKLGVSPMALYNHVENKNDLLRGVLDLLVRRAAAFEPGVEPDDWRAWTTESFLRVYRSLREQSELVALTIGLEELTPATREASEVALGVLQRAGFAAPDAVRLFSTLSRFVLGAVMLPMIRVSPAGTEALSPDESVRHGIELILDGFAFQSLVEVRFAEASSSKAV